MGEGHKKRGRELFEHGQIGILGFYAGPGVHILEANGLTDAFLARLPARPGWRIGHFVRQLPNGYLGTLRKGVNRLSEPELRALYRRVTLVARAPLFDRERLHAVWDLNFGAGRELPGEYFRLHSRVQRVALGDVSSPKQDGDDLQAVTRRFSDWGLEVELGRLRHPLAVELSLDGNDVYKLVCVKQGVAMAEREIQPRLTPEGGLSLRRVELDRQSARWGCDVLRILPVTGDLDYRLGHVAILEELSEGDPAEPEEPLTPQPAEPETPGEGEQRQQHDRLPGGR